MQKELPTEGSVASASGTANGSNLVQMTPKATSVQPSPMSPREMTMWGNLLRYRYGIPTPVAENDNPPEGEDDKDND